MDTKRINVRLCKIEVIYLLFIIVISSNQRENNAPLIIFVCSISNLTPGVISKDTYLEIFLPKRQATG